MIDINESRHTSIKQMFNEICLQMARFGTSKGLCIA